MKRPGERGDGVARQSRGKGRERVQHAEELCVRLIACQIIVMIAVTYFPFVAPSPLAQN